MTSIRAIGSMLGRLRLSTELIDEIEESRRCPRCGAEMESVGSGLGCLGSVYFVVPPILVLKSPQCGYEERSWALPRAS